MEEEKEQIYKMLGKSFEVINKMSDVQETQVKYEKEMKLIEEKYRFKKFISILIFIFILVLSCWSVFYVCYFNATVMVEKHYISNNTNTNINNNSNINNTINGEGGMK